MNETRTINLNGLVYHIDNNAYQALDNYLTDIKQSLPQDVQQEVMIDVEARIAELFQKALFAQNAQIISLSMVEAIKAQIGDPSEFGENRRPKVKVDKSQNAGCSRAFSIALNIILAILAFPMILIGLIILFSIIISLISVAIAGTTSISAILPIFPLFAEILVDGRGIIIPLLIVALIAIIVLPITMLIHTIITYMRTRRGPKARFWWITILLWLASMIFWGVSILRIYDSINEAPKILNTMVFDDLEMDDMGVATSPLALSPYHSIELKGAAKLQLSNAEEPSTWLTTNLVETLLNPTDLKVEVQDSILYIEVFHHSLSDEVVVDFKIANPELRRITLDGAGKIETADNQVFSQQALTLNLNGAAKADLHLAVKELEITAKGASKLELEGTADKATISITGAGEVEAEDLITQILHIYCAGASKAEVFVAQELWAQAVGASKISYNGNPTIKQSISTGGSNIYKD